MFAPKTVFALFPIRKGSGDVFEFFLYPEKDW